MQVKHQNPIMMQFCAYLANERSAIPHKFLLPFENKFVLFKENRTRDLHDPRDTTLLVGTFLFVKVLAGKLFFKPYKLTDHFETDYHDLENPGNFKDNCVVMGYTVVALWTDLVFDLFKPEIQKREQSQLKDEELRNRAK